MCQLKLSVFELPHWVPVTSLSVWIAARLLTAICRRQSLFCRCASIRDSRDRCLSVLLNDYKLLRGAAPEMDATFDRRLRTALCLLWATWQPGRRRGTSWLAPGVVHLVSLIGTERWREGPPSCLLWARLCHVTAWSQAEVVLLEGYQRSSSRNSIRQPIRDAPTAWTQSRAAVYVKYLYIAYLSRNRKYPEFMKFALTVLQTLLICMCVSRNIIGTM